MDSSSFLKLYPKDDAVFLPGRGIQIIFHWCTLPDSLPQPLCLKLINLFLITKKSGMLSQIV